MADYNQQTTGWTGWVMFASLLMILSGFVHILYGIGSLFTQNWFLYANQSIYLIDAKSGGWALILVGILLLVSGTLLLSGNAFGRAMGMVLATVGIIANLAYVGIAPIWSILAVIVNALILYAIGAHGGEMKKLT